MRKRTSNLGYVIRELVLNQYEDGWRSTADIDRLTENILAEVESFLDSWPGISYNRGQERENNAHVNQS